MSEASIVLILALHKIASSIAFFHIFICPVYVSAFKDQFGENF